MNKVSNTLSSLKELKKYISLCKNCNGEKCNVCFQAGFRLTKEGIAVCTLIWRVFNIPLLENFRPDIYDQLKANENNK